MKLGEVCIHKSLRRQCETCEIADERDRLKAELARLDGIASEVQTDRNLWKSRAEKLAEALRKMEKRNFHIGNDINGNVFGPPDGVMCRHIALEALSDFEAGK